MGVGVDMGVGAGAGAGAGAGVGVGVKVSVGVVLGVDVDVDVGIREGRYGFGCGFVGAGMIIQSTLLKTAPLSFCSLFCCQQSFVPSFVVGEEYFLL